MTNKYVELHCHSYFSLLDGASSPEALVTQAKTLGLHALALTDHDNLAGAVRFWTAAQQAQLHAIIGAEITLETGHHLTLLAETQQGYANLCRLLTLAHYGDLSSVTTWSTCNQQWPGKTAPQLTWDTLATHSQGLLVLTGCRRGPVAAALLQDQPEQAKVAALRLRDIFGVEQVWVELQHLGMPQDDWLINALISVARMVDLPTVVTNNVHYATKAGSKLCHALLAIAQNASLTQARRAGHLPLNHNQDLASPQVMGRRFGHLPQALRNTVVIAERCKVSLDFSNHVSRLFQCRLV